jgi:alkylhydroperoxidase family enzyme
MPQEILDAVLDDWKTADIPEKTRGALELLEYMTVHPQDIDQELIQKLRNDGLDDLAIREAVNVGFHYNLIDRIADAFDFPVPKGLQKKRLARMLNLSGRIMKGGYSEESWVQADDGVIRPGEVEIGRTYLLTVDGSTQPDLRQAVEAFVTSQWGVKRRNAPDLPDELKDYLKKLSLHAYRIIDDDINSLRSAGYSDELIYEITLVGAVGAALVGLEGVFNAMYQDKP